MNKELENDVNSANDAEKDRIDQIIKSETTRDNASNSTKR